MTQSPVPARAAAPAHAAKAGSDAPRSHTGRFFAASFLLLFALTASLSLITPVYGGLDERAHMTYGLAVVQGEVPFEGRDVEVENWVQSTHGECWETDITQSSLCMKPLNNDTTEKWARTTASNYPPLYYALVSWPSFFLAGTPAFFAARLLSALLFSALSALGVTALGAARGRPLLSITAIAFVTPSTIAIGGMVNPQALELGAAIATAGLLIPLLETPADSPRRLMLAAIAMFAWIQARPVGPVWPLIFCSLLLLAMGWSRIRPVLRLKSFWVFLAAAAVSSLMWLWWRTIAPADLIHAEACDLGCSISHVLASEDLKQVTNTTGALNVHAPSIFAVPYYGALLGVFLLALLGARARQALAISLGILAIPAMALAIQISAGNTGGAMWQGRYALPLSLPLVMLALTLAFSLPFFSSVLARRFALAATLSYAFVMVPFTALAVERFWLGEHFPSFFDVDWSIVPLHANLGLAVIVVACLILVVLSITARSGHAHAADHSDSGISATSEDSPSASLRETDANPVVIERS